MFSCKDVAVLISQDMDRDISFVDSLKLRFHLLICRVCRRLRQQLLVQREAAEMANQQTYSEVPPSLTMPRESRDRIKEMMRDEKNPPTV